jgi:peptidoglycan/xylan/chitin deacetylase (PgdA/CDA1 family)
LKALSIGYHDVVDGTPQGPVKMRYRLDREDFRRHLDAIPAGVEVQTITRCTAWGREVPVFLTIDDGELSSLTIVAGELERRNWRGHFFITTDWIGRPGFLDRGQIRELHARGHVIGSHSRSHPARMSRLNWDEMLREWRESCDILSGILGERVSVASVPDGYYSRKVARAAAAAPIEVLFTSEPTAAAAVVQGCLVLGRYSVQRHTPAEVSGLIAAGARWPRWRQTISWEAKKAAKAVTGESYFTLRRFLLSR